MPSFTSGVLLMLSVWGVRQNLTSLAESRLSDDMGWLAETCLMGLAAAASALLLLWCLPFGLASVSVGRFGLRRTFLPFRTTRRWRAGDTLDTADLARGETCQDNYLVWIEPGRAVDRSYGLGTAHAFSLGRYCLTDEFGRRVCELADEFGVTVTDRARYRLCDPVGMLGAATQYNADTPPNLYDNPHRPACAGRG